MKSRKKILSLLSVLTVFFAGVLSSCVVQEEGWELSVDKLSIYVGDMALVSVLSDESQSVVWMNSNENTCEIQPISGSNYARIYGRGEGTASVTACAGGIRRSVEVEVLKTKITVDVKNNAAVIDMDKGQTTLDLGVKAFGCDMDELIIRSDNYAVAEVDQKGLVTAKRSGFANVFVESPEGDLIKVEVTVINSKQISVDYPKTVDGGMWPTGHVQGIAIDTERKYLYYTFTTIFVKTDLQGHVVGSFSGYEGHLGDCTYNSRDGKVYSSLSCIPGEYSWTGKAATYIAVINVDKITKTGMDAYDDGIMKTIYLKDVAKDYFVDLNGDGIVEDGLNSPDRKYGVWGIDGICFGPKFGSSDKEKQYLTVAYAIAKNEKRTDNDYLVFLQYDVDGWYKLGRELNPRSPHDEGPDKADGKYFAYVGNTDYAVQCMDYDKEHDFWVCITYNYQKTIGGLKEDFTSDTTFLIDNSKKPEMGLIKGQSVPEYGYRLSLVKEGHYSQKTGIYSWSFWMGNTGFISLGNDLYYISEHRYVGGMATTKVTLYRYTGSIDRDSNQNDLFAKA